MSENARDMVVRIDFVYNRSCMVFPPNTFHNKGKPVFIIPPVNYDTDTAVFIYL